MKARPGHVCDKKSMTESVTKEYRDPRTGKLVARGVKVDEACIRCRPPVLGWK